jgi:ribosomal protein S18 acetylase RimI-like enzyme
MCAVQSYIRATAIEGREVERIGPFLATFTARSANPFLNYAIPDDGARPSKSDVAGLTAAFERRRLIPRLEFLTGAAPSVEAVLVENGYALERRVPLMICPSGAVVAQPAPGGIELLIPESDAELSGMISAQDEAFGEPGTVSAESLQNRRDQLERGGLAVLARACATGESAGGALGTPLIDGTTEVVGVGVRAKYRHRGIGAALTEFLTRTAFERDAWTVFLTPDGVPEERLYARVGFRPAGECVHLRRAGI